MDHVTLLGAEEVSRAGGTISDAAERMQRAANQIDDTMERHARAMETFIQRYEELVQRQEKAMEEKVEIHGSPLRVDPTIRGTAEDGE